MTAAETLNISESIAVSTHVSSSRYKRLIPVAIVAVYLSLGFVAYYPLTPWTTNRLFGTGADSMLASWFFAWIPHSLSHGLNPLFSSAIYFPDGVNLAQNTTSPLLGLLSAPWALLMGPIAVGNLLVILAMPLSATAAYFVLRHWQVSEMAAAIGGLVYGFSAYAVGQGLGHPVLTFIPLPPLIAATVVTVVQRRGSYGRLGVQLGLLLAAQFLIEPEIFVIVVLLAAWTLAVVAVRYPKKALEDAASIWKPMALAFVVMGAILAYPVWMELLGPQHYIGPAQPTNNPYHSDVFSFIQPGPLQRVGFGMRTLGAPLSNEAENGSFIGLPLVVVALFLAWRSRRSYRMQIAILVTVSAAILSLGKRLQVRGHVTGIRLPFDLLAHLPLTNNIIPSRFAVGIFLGLAAALAFGIDDVWRGPKTVAKQRSRIYRRRGTLLGVGALIVLVVTQLPQWPYSSQPVHSLPKAIREAIPAGNPVAVTYPYATAYTPDAQLWQLQEGFSFRLIGGYAEHPDTRDHSTGIPNPMNPPPLGLFLEGQEGFSREVYPPVPITSGLVDATRTALARNAVRLVIVDRAAVGAGPAMTLFTTVLGPPKVSDGAYALWGASGTTPL